MHVSFENNGRGPGRWVKLPRELLFPGVEAQVANVAEAVAT
jgi:hypothetical protein